MTFATARLRHAVPKVNVSGDCPEVNFPLDLLVGSINQRNSKFAEVDVAVKMDVGREALGHAWTRQTSNDLAPFDLRMSSQFWLRISSCDVRSPSHLPVRHCLHLNRNLYLPINIPL